MRILTPLEDMPVLVAEDDMIQAADLTNSLQCAGATVLGPAITVDKALRLITDRDCGAAVVDFKFGRQDAVPLVDELFLRRIPFIVYTGYNGVEPLLPKWQGCRVVSKPANAEKLIRDLMSLATWPRAERPERNWQETVPIMAK